MNTLTRLAIFAVTASMPLLPRPACSQGNLTPSGPPSATMRTLEQVEPRIPLEAQSPGVTANANGGFTITQSGSYYLTKNLAVASGDGIKIDVNNVTIDLRGFTISSTANPAGGIAVTMPGSEPKNIAVHNGHISGGVTRSGDTFSGSGFVHGIESRFQSRGVRVSDVSVQGVSSDGINVNLGSADVVERCTVVTAGGVGIQASTVVNCAVFDTGAGGIEGDVVQNCIVTNARSGISAKSVTNSRAEDNRNRGISASTVVSCSANRNGGIGIVAAVVKDCDVTFNSSHGIQVSGLAKDNRAAYNGSGGTGAGIYFELDGVRIEANNCFDNDYGIQGIADTDSFIVRNSCKSNGGAPANGGATGDYDFPSSNTFGPIITVSGDMSANGATSHPWANFRY